MWTEPFRMASGGAGTGPSAFPVPDKLEYPLRDLLTDLLARLPPSWPSWSRLGMLLLALTTTGLVLRYVLQAVLMRVRRRMLRRNPPAWLHLVLDQRVLRRTARIVLPLTMQIGLGSSPYSAGPLSRGLASLVSAWLVWCVLAVLLGLLDALLESQLYDNGDGAAARRRLDFKSYVQLAKLLVVLGGLVIMAGELTQRSPLLLLSGLGALSAILMLVFKDTILSFTAGVQLASNDMLRVGDWIEMPQVGADGQVDDVTLHAVKVKNWDNTFTTIPTWRLVSESYRNWRGMSESGSRRIKRSLPIDATSVRFLTAQELCGLERIALLREYLNEKRVAIDVTNAALQHELPQDLAGDPVNQRRLTNLGTFRAYVAAYLAQHSGLRRDMTQLVSILNPTTEGVPLQIYCFTATTDWMEYERILGNLFDHFLAVLPEFGLRIFQQPSGYDMRLLVPTARAAGAVAAGDAAAARRFSAAAPATKTLQPADRA